MSSAMFENMAKIAAASKLPPPSNQQSYAFTEVINVTWSHAVNLEDTSSEESRLWTRTLQTYSAHPGTTAVWWGQLVQAPEIFKLIIDWKSPDGHQAFQSSPEFAQLLQAWPSTSITTDTALYFKLPSDHRYRQNAFQPPDRNGYFKDVVTVFITSHFASDWTPDTIEPLDTCTPQRPRKVCFDNAWMLVRQAALHSEGGWVSDKALEGWSASDAPGTLQSFLGVVRFRDVQTAVQFLQLAEDSEQTSADASFERLRRLADRGVAAEVVKMIGGELSVT